MKKIDFAKSATKFTHSQSSPRHKENNQSHIVDQELGSTSQILYDTHSQNLIYAENFDQQSISYPYTGISAPQYPPQLISQFSSSQYYPNLELSGSDILMQNKIIELNQSLSSEIDARKQADLRCKDLASQSQKFSILIDDIKIKHHAEIVDLQKKIKDLENCLKEYKFKVSDLESAQIKMRDDAICMKRNLNHDTEENLNLRERIYELNKKIEDNQKLFIEKEEEVNKKQQELMKIKRRLDSQQEEIELVKSREQKIKNEMKDLELTNSNLNDENEKLILKNQDLNERINMYLKENDQLRLDMQEYTFDLKKKMTEIENMKSDIRELKTENKELRDSEDILNLELEKATNEIQNLKLLLSNNVQLPQEYYHLLNLRTERSKSKEKVRFKNTTDKNSKKDENLNMLYKSTYIKRLERKSQSPDWKYQAKYKKDVASSTNFEQEPYYTNQKPKIDNPPRIKLATLEKRNQQQSNDSKYNSHNKEKNNFNTSNEPFDEKQQQLKVTETSLASMLLEKDKLEKELAKLEVGRRTKASLDRRKEIEEELESLMKDLIKTKAKLKSLINHR